MPPLRIYDSPIGTIGLTAPCERWVRLVVACVAMSVSGCVTQQERPNVPDLGLPSGFVGTQGGATDSVPVTAKPGTFAHDLDRELPIWWRMLGNPELNLLIGRALRDNRELRAAQARIAQARARAAQVEAGHLPLITASVRTEADAPRDGIGSLSSGEDRHTSKIQRIGLNGEMRLDIWGERDAESESASFLVWRAIYQRDDVQRRLIAQVIVAYIGILSFNDRLRMARETEEVLAGTLRAVEARAGKDGVTTSVDRDRQRAALFSARATTVTLKQQRTENANELASLLGGLPGSVTLSDRGLDSLHVPEVIPGLPADLLLRRPDIRMVEARLLSANADIDVARARVLPPLDIAMQAGFGSYKWANLLQSHSLFWGAIVGLTTTIFDHGKRRREVDFARALHEELTENYVRVVHGAIREVEDSLNALRANDEQLAARREAAAAARQAWLRSQKLYAAGVSDYATLLDVERTNQRDATDLHVTRASRHRALVSLFQALGGGVSIQDISPTGKELRPVVATTEKRAGLALTATEPSKVSEDWNISEGHAWERSGTWVVELAGAVGEEGAVTTANMLVARFPERMQRLTLERRHLWSAMTNDGKETPWYRLLIASFETFDVANDFCAALRTEGIRCRLVSRKGIDGAEQTGNSTSDSAKQNAAVSYNAPK